MPATVVKTERDERLWAKAKARVAEQYGLSEGDGDRYWRLVNGVYSRMKGKGGTKVRVRKGRVKAHTRKLPSGRVVTVGEYHTRRGKKAEEPKKTQGQSRVVALVHDLVQGFDLPVRLKHEAKHRDEGRRMDGGRESVKASATDKTLTTYDSLCGDPNARDIVLHELGHVLWKNAPDKKQYQTAFLDVALSDEAAVLLLKQRMIEGERDPEQLHSELFAEWVNGRLPALDGFFRSQVPRWAARMRPDAGKRPSQAELKEREAQLSLYERMTAPVRKSAATKPVRLKPHVRAGKPVAGSIQRRKAAEPQPKAKPKPKTAEAVATGEIIYDVPLAQIRPDPEQHRQLFDKRKLQQLADSIKTAGQKTPIVLRRLDEPVGEVKYQIIAGERRWRATKLLKRKTIKAVIREGVGAEDALIEQVIENINRAEVTPTEEATAYRQLADMEIARAKRRKDWRGKDFKDPANEAALETIGRNYAARQSGKGRKHVDYYIILTDLPEEVREMVDKGALTTAHAHALLRLVDPKEDARVREPKKRKERMQHLVRMARHARAHGHSAKITNGMVTEYIRSDQQQVMFEEEEITGGEKQVLRQEQRSRIGRIVEAVTETINAVWSEKRQEFDISALTATDLQIALRQVSGAEQTFAEIKQAIEREMLAREAVEATKRRVVRTDATASEPTVQTTSLFKSLFTPTERQAIGFCIHIAREYGIYAPNQSVPRRVQKAVAKRKQPGARFTKQQLESLGLAWRTMYPQGRGGEGYPVLVKDLGDEYMVVGGPTGAARGAAFTRFKKKPDELKAKPKAKPKKELAPEVEEELHEKLDVAAEQAKAAREAVRRRIAEMIGTVPDLTDEQRRDIEERALAKAKDLALSEEGKGQFVKDALKAAEEEKAEQQDKLVRDAANKAVEAAAVEAATGTPTTPEVEQVDAQGRRVRVPLTKEQYEEIKNLVVTEVQTSRYASAIRRALRVGGTEAARALELDYAPMSQEEQERWFQQSHEQFEKARVNSALVDAVHGRSGVAMTNNMVRGSSHAAAGIASDAVGATILSAKTAKTIGIVAASRITGRYLASKTDAASAAKALRAFIAEKGSVEAAAAVKASEDMRARGETMRQESLEAGLISQAQANAAALSYGNEADKTVGEALGALETAAQTALELERIGRGAELEPIRIDGGTSEATAKQRARDLGLENTPEEEQFAIRKREGRRVIELTDAGIAAIAQERTLDEYLIDAEAEEIKERGAAEGWLDEQGNDWKAEGQRSEIILQPHQQANVKLWERRRNILVGDEAGTGKTAVALCGISHLHKQGKVKKALVVVPAIVLSQMAGGDAEDEVHKFLGDEYHDKYVGMDTSKSHANTREKRATLYQGDQVMTFVTHDTLRNDFDMIQAAGYDALVVDEAHYFTVRGQAEGSLRSQRARQLDVPYKMLMTGTPVRNDLSELWSLVDWLNPGSLGDKGEFLARYGSLSRGTGPFDRALLRDLQARVSGTLTATRLSRAVDAEGEVYYELDRTTEPGAPPIESHHEDVWVDLSPEQTEAYRAAEKGYLETRAAMTETDKADLAAARRVVAREKRKPGSVDKTELGRAKRTVSKFSAANAFSRDAKHNHTVNNINVEDHPKVLAMKERLAKHEGEKVIAFATNLFAVETMAKGLGLKKEEYRVIDGSTPKHVRNEYAKEINDPKSPVRHLLCTDAANFGLNVQGASVVVNYDLTDTFANHWQRIARSFRRGQQRNVSVYNLRTKSRYERRGQEILDKKRGEQHLVESLHKTDPSGLHKLFSEYLQEAA